MIGASDNGEVIMSVNVGVESLKVNGEIMTGKEGIREAMRQFWEEVGGVGEGLDTREECETLERKEGCRI